MRLPAPLLLLAVASLACLSAIQADATAHNVTHRKLSGTCPVGGRCGSDGGGCTCPTGQCCSKFNHCGITSSHCGPDCQPNFGSCTVSSPSPRSPSPRSPSPVRSPSPIRSPSPPLQGIDLSPFSIQLPIAEQGSNSFMIVKQPEANRFSLPGIFFTNSAGALVMVTNAGGVKSSNSKFARTELREEASWDITSNTLNTLTWSGSTQRLTPVVKKVCIAQIKNEAAEPLQIRVQGAPDGTTKIVVVSIYPSYKERGTLDNNYKLGSKYTIKVVAGAGAIRIFYNSMSQPAISFASNAKGCHFKLGNYPQANVDMGEAASSTSEVWINALSLAG